VLLKRPIARKFMDVGLCRHEKAAFGDARQ